MGSLKAPIALGFAVVLVSAWAASALAADMVIGVSGKARVHNDVGRAICRQI